MSLPSLSSLTCVRCNDDVGVTRQSFTALFPGMSFKEGINEEDVLEPNDLECAICGNFLNHPFDGFSVEKGDSPEIVEAEKNFNKLKIPSEIDAARSAFYRKGSAAADLIRTRNPVRTQIEILDPGCKHQFHKECISNWCKSGRSNSKNCPLCQIPIDGQLFASLTISGSSSASGSSSSGVGLVRQRSPEEDGENIFQNLPPFGPVDTDPPIPMPNPVPNQMPLLPSTSNVPIPENTAANQYRRYFRSVWHYMTQLEFLLGRLGGMSQGEETVWRRLSDHMIAQPRYISWQMELIIALFDVMFEEHSQFEVFPMVDSQPYFEWDEIIGRCYFVYRAFASENDLFHTRPRTATISTVMTILFNLVKALVDPLTRIENGIGVEADAGAANASFSGWSFSRGLTGIQPNPEYADFPEMLLVKMTYLPNQQAVDAELPPIFQRLDALFRRINDTLNTRILATNELAVTGEEKEVYHNLLTFSTLLWNAYAKLSRFGHTVYLDHLNIHIANFFQPLVIDFDDESGQIIATILMFEEALRRVNASRT